MLKKIAGTGPSAPAAKLRNHKLVYTPSRAIAASHPRRPQRRTAR